MKVLLKNLAKIDRVKKGQIYKSGTVFIGVSATRGGDVHYLEEDGEIEDKYAAVEFDGRYNSKYLYYAILSVHEKWLSKYIQNINVPISNLKEMQIDIVADVDKQNEIVNKLNLLDIWAESEKQMISAWKSIKKTALEKMFI
nr:MAG TPA: hypothetical protein [Caudoviricetes sp.]